VRNAARLKREASGRGLELLIAHPDSQTTLQHVKGLVLALVGRAAESLVVLRDVCRLKAKEAEELARWAAFTLLRASLGESESSNGKYSGRGRDAPYAGAVRFCWAL